MQDGSGVATRKLAEVVAREIEREIVQRDWPVGEVLGSEAELLAKYQVSRQVLREAIRLLEHHFTARMRRGPGGGLVVSEPDSLAVTEAVARYLQSRRVRPADIFQLRAVLELSAVQLACENIDEAGVLALRNALAAEQSTSPDEMPEHSADFHLAVAELSGNPAMLVFIKSLTRLSQERAFDVRKARPENVAPLREKENVHRAHLGIAEAIIVGDVGLAHHRMRTHLNAIEQYMDDPH